MRHPNGRLLDTCREFRFSLACTPTAVPSIFQYIDFKPGTSKPTFLGSCSFGLDLVGLSAIQTELHHSTATLSIDFLMQRVFAERQDGDSREMLLIVVASRRLSNMQSKAG